MKSESEAEIRDRVERYAKLSDDEIAEHAAVAYSLKESAKAALLAEIRRRRLGLTLTEIAPSTVDKNSFVVLRHFLDLPSALLAKTVLDSAAIECSLNDDNVVRMDWFYSNAVGGVKLLVRREDAENAARLLDQEALEEFEVPEVGEFKQPHCPNCDSPDISHKGLHRNAAYATVAIGIPFPVSHVAWHCNSCKHSWEGSEESPENLPKA